MSIVTFVAFWIMLIARSPLASIVRFWIVTPSAPLTLIARPAVDVKVLPLPSNVIALSIVMISFEVMSRMRVTTSPALANSIASAREVKPW